MSALLASLRYTPYLVQSITTALPRRKVCLVTVKGPRKLNRKAPRAANRTGREGGTVLYTPTLLPGKLRSMSNTYQHGAFVLSSLTLLHDKSEKL